MGKFARNSDRDTVKTARNCDISENRGQELRGNLQGIVTDIQ